MDAIRSREKIEKAHFASMRHIQRNSAIDMRAWAQGARLRAAITPALKAACDALLAAEDERLLGRKQQEVPKTSELAPPRPKQPATTSHGIGGSALAEDSSSPSPELCNQTVEFRPELSDAYCMLEMWQDARGGESYASKHIEDVVACLVDSKQLTIKVDNERFDDFLQWVASKKNRNATLKLLDAFGERIDPLLRFVYLDRFQDQILDSGMPLYPSIGLRAPLARRTLFFGTMQDSRLLFLTARQDVNWTHLDPHFRSDGEILSSRHSEHESKMRVLHVRGWLLEAPPPLHDAAKILGVSQGEPEDTLSTTQLLFSSKYPGEQVPKNLFSLKLKMSLPRGVLLDESLQIKKVLPPTPNPLQDDAQSLNECESDEKPAGMIVQSQVGVALFLKPMQLESSDSICELSWFKPSSSFSQPVRRLPLDPLEELSNLRPWGDKVAEEMKLAASFSAL